MFESSITLIRALIASQMKAARQKTGQSPKVNITLTFHLSATNKIYSAGASGWGIRPKSPSWQFPT